MRSWVYSGPRPSIDRGWPPNTAFQLTAARSEVDARAPAGRRSAAHGRPPRCGHPWSGAIRTGVRGLVRWLAISALFGALGRIFVLSHPRRSTWQGSIRASLPKPSPETLRSQSFPCSSSTGLHRFPADELLARVSLWAVALRCVADPPYSLPGAHAGSSSLAPPASALPGPDGSCGRWRDRRVVLAGHRKADLAGVAGCAAARLTPRRPPVDTGWYTGNRSLASVRLAAKSGEDAPLTNEIDTIASHFFAAIERGDLAAVRELYSPKAEIWHNVTGTSQTREENLALLQFFTRRVSELRYEVLAREFFEGGFVQRHILHGKLGSGDRVAAPVCLVVYVSRGHIERLFEYLDPATVRGAFT